MSSLAAINKTLLKQNKLLKESVGGSATAVAKAAEDKAESKTYDTEVLSTLKSIRDALGGSAGGGGGGKDGVKKGKTGYFFLGERVEKGTTSSELVIDHPFNPKKLKVETCNFNGWETIDSITYDKHSIDRYMGDSTHKDQEFQVIKVKN